MNSTRQTYRLLVAIPHHFTNSQKMKCGIDGKSQRLGYGCWPLSGKDVKPLAGMIYWYGWGDDEDFDIRVIRRILSLPEEQPSIDHWFMAKKPNHGKAYLKAMRQITDALNQQGLDFADVMRRHDQIIEQEIWSPSSLEKAQEALDQAPF